MSLPRLRLENCSFVDGRWQIDKEQAHHLIRVRRCCTGSLVEGLQSGEKVCLRIMCDGETVFAEELSRNKSETESVELHLILALLKSDQLDSALRFAAETGVATIRLLSCERSIPRYTDKRLGEKMKRWGKILSESTKQSGSTAPPLLFPPVLPAQLDYTLIPACRYAALLMRDAVSLAEVEVRSPAAVAIGPEGDWSPSETELLLEKDFVPVSLGKRILRASTAVAVACGWFSLN